MMSEQKSALSVKIEVDTKEAQEDIKELAKAADECVVALSKLETVMGRFTNKNEQKDIKAGIVLDGIRSCSHLRSDLLCRLKITLKLSRRYKFFLYFYERIKEGEY